VNRANEYRKIVDVAPLTSHSAIVEAAQNHADYYVLNRGVAGAWTNGPHGEVAGYPGFTGTDVSARLDFAGYLGESSGEVMHYIGDPTISVDGWMATVYHRLPIIDPNRKHAGYALNTQPGVDAMDFGAGPAATGVWMSATPYPLAYPVDGQTNIPVGWSGLEIPNPLPPGVSTPVGYPFTIQGVNGTLFVEWAEMRDGSGNLVPTHPNPTAECGPRNCYTLIPVSPLAQNTTYTVSARGTIALIPFDLSWSFTTESGYTVMSSQAEPVTEQVIGPPEYNPLAAPAEKGE